MIIKTDGSIIVADDCQTFSINKTRYYLEGVFFLRGKRIGAESVIEVDRRYKETGEFPFSQSFGAYSMAIVEDDEILVFNDNSNQNCFYRGANVIGTDFVSVCKLSEKTEFDYFSICQLLSLGAVYFGDTLIKEIKVTDNAKYYVVKHNKIEEKEKGIGSIDGASAIDNIYDFFNDIAYSLYDKKVTLSLTGGYDSRMIFALLNDKMKLDVFMSGNNEDDPDMYWAKKTAKAGEKELDVVKIKKPNVNDELIQKLFSFGDGIIPQISNGSYRIISFLNRKKKDGFEVYITGDGGPRYKDWNWIQDFPFYNKKKFSLKRYYYQNVEIVRKKRGLSLLMLEQHKQLEGYFIDNVKKYKMNTNTQSYDSFGYYTLSDFVKCGNNNTSRIVRTYSPLWEFELVRYSYSLPRKKRFFNNFMRDVTTTCNAKIARVKTVYHMTSSNEVFYKVKDGFYYAFEYAKRGIRYLGRITVKKTFFTGKLIEWDIIDEVKNLDIAKKAVTFCKQKNILDLSVTLENIPNNLVNVAVHLYLLDEALNK